jgi:hypothetical protein
MYRFSWPRSSLVQQTARQLSRRLVEHWIAKGTPGIAEAVPARVRELLAEHGFGPEAVGASIDDACAHTLGKAPAAFCDAITEGLAAKAPTGVDEAAVAQALAQLEQLVGPPPSRKRSSRSKVNLLNGPTPPALEAPLEEAMRVTGEAWYHKLHQLVFSMMEEPQFRLAGVETAVGLLGSVLAQMVETQERSVPDLNTRAAEAYERVHGQVGGLTGFGAWFRNKNQAVSDLVESLRLFAKLRYQALLADRTCTIGRHLLATYPEFAHDINISRGRLGDFLRTLHDPVATKTVEVDLGSGRELCPPGCRNRAEARDQILERLTPAELLSFDRQVQELIQKEFTSLWQICLAPSTNLFEDLGRVLQQQAEVFVENILGGLDAADFYLRTHPQEDRVVEEISEAFATASPDLTRTAPPAADELHVMAVPQGPAGDHLYALARRALPQKDVVMAGNADDIVFYREQVQVALAELEQLGPAALDAYRQMTAVDSFTPHSRTDITVWTSVRPGS